jgi:hypothetical protein
MELRIYTDGIPTTAEHGRRADPSQDPSGDSDDRRKSVTCGCSAMGGGGPWKRPLLASARGAAFAAFLAMRRSVAEPFRIQRLDLHANVRDDRYKSRETLPLLPTSRPKDIRDGSGTPCQWVGPLGHGSEVQSPDALDHRTHRQAEYRRLTGGSAQRLLPAPGSLSLTTRKRPASLR